MGGVYEIEFYFTPYIFVGYLVQMRCLHLKPYKSEGRSVVIRIKLGDSQTG